MLDREVSFNEASLFAEENGICFSRLQTKNGGGAGLLFAETSAKSGEGVEKVFLETARMIVTRIVDGRFLSNFVGLINF